ncbi:hypothetical protein L9F63_020820, partial [Diploptera punctata]
ETKITEVVLSLRILCNSLPILRKRQLSCMTGKSAVNTISAIAHGWGNKSTEHNFGTPLINKTKNYITLVISKGYFVQITGVLMLWFIYDAMRQRKNCSP